MSYTLQFGIFNYIQYPTRSLRQVHKLLTTGT